MYWWMGALTTMMGLCLFYVKNQVVSLEHRSEILQQQLQEEEESFHLLQVEWNTLNDPARLKDLANRYLKLAPLRGDQLVTAPLPGVFARTVDEGHRAAVLCRQDNRQGHPFEEVLPPSVFGPRGYLG